MKPEIYAKSAMMLSQLSNRKKLDCSGIEIQMLDELFRYNPGMIAKYSDVYHMNWPAIEMIKVVHAPILSSFGLPDVNLEEFVTTQQQFFNEIVNFAADISSQYHNDITIIVHSGLTFDNMISLNIIECVKEVLKRTLYENPGIHIAIENVTPITNETMHISLVNNFLFDNVNLVNELRSSLCTDRIGTVLDTCHAEISLQVETMINNFLGNQDRYRHTLDDYFSANKDICKLIHMSYTKNNGYGPAKHGLPFTDNDKHKIYEYLSLYNKYQYKCPITLEVSEDDYNYPFGYKKSKELLDEVASQLHL